MEEPHIECFDGLNRVIAKAKNLYGDALTICWRINLSGSDIDFENPIEVWGLWG